MRTLFDGVTVQEGGLIAVTCPGAPEGALAQVSVTIPDDLTEDERHSAAPQNTITTQQPPPSGSFVTPTPAGSKAPPDDGPSLFDDDVASPQTQQAPALPTGVPYATKTIRDLEAKRHKLLADI